MSRPEAVRRVKSYSAATGYVYQYYFYEVKKARYGFASGTDYIYMVSVDRKNVFPVRIFVRGDAVEKWSRTAGRPLSGTEEYAAAKMRLFDALDETEKIDSGHAEFLVNESNLTELLAKLDL